MKSILNSKIAWSLLNPCPIFVHSQSQGITACVWNGVILSGRAAMAIYAIRWVGMNVRSNLRDAISREHEKLVAEGFRAWDIFSPSDPLAERGLTARFLDDLRTNYTPKEALLWFSPNNCEVIDRLIAAVWLDRDDHRHERARINVRSDAIRSVFSDIYNRGRIIGQADVGR